MIPAPFTYQRASSVDEALELAARAGEDAKFLAGGHSLMPLMKLRLAVPETLIDIGRLGELSYVRADDGHIAVGALTTHDDIARSDLL
ncbi:MAG TPA: FAD binding domain-containing protein, partial [Actinomycetes bacterium]